MEASQYKCDPYWHNVSLIPPPLWAQKLHTVEDFFFLFGGEAKLVISLCHVSGRGGVGVVAQTQRFDPKDLIRTARISGVFLETPLMYNAACSSWYGMEKSWKLCQTSGAIRTSTLPQCVIQTSG